MTESREVPGVTRHLLRPSVPGAVPPVPDRGGERLRLSLGFVRHDADGAPTARIYAYPDPPREGGSTQLDDLAAGDRIRVRGWDFTVEEISDAGVTLALAPGTGDA